MTQELTLSTKSYETVPLQIIPQRSSNFSFKFNPLKPLSAQSKIKIFITFIPFECKEYQANIRLFSGEMVSIVEIEAYPMMIKDLSLNFPSKIELGDHQIGTNLEISRDLTSFSQKQLFFRIEVLEDCPEIKIFSNQKSIPSKSSIPVVITFKPTEYKLYKLKAKVD